VLLAQGGGEQQERGGERGEKAEGRERIDGRNQRSPFFFFFPGDK